MKKSKDCFRGKITTKQKNKKGGKFRMEIIIIIGVIFLILSGGLTNMVGKGMK